jgi:hypothetical protein
MVADLPDVVSVSVGLLTGETQDMMRQADQGADKPVSSVLDNWRNRVDRYEDIENQPRIVVTLSDVSPLTVAQVEAWYWERIAVWSDPVEQWEPDTEHPIQQQYAETV